MTLEDEDEAEHEHEPMTEAELREQVMLSLMEIAGGVTAGGEGKAVTSLADEVNDGVAVLIALRVAIKNEGRSLVKAIDRLTAAVERMGNNERKLNHGEK